MSIEQRIREFLRDDKGGERDTMTTLIIIAVIVVPLVALLITFQDRVKQFAEQMFKTIVP